MNRTTVLLTAVFLVLLAATVYLLWPEGERQASYELVDRYLEVDSAKATMMALRSNETVVRFEKIGGEWFITAPLKDKADQTSILQLLAQTRSFEVKSLVSENPARQSMFEVDTSGTLLVFGGSDGTVDSLIVGKSAPNFLDRYVRKVGSDKVYLAGGLKSWLLRRKVKEWRDKTIVNMPRELLQRVTVTLGRPERTPSENSYILEKREDRWFVGPDSTKESAVNSLLRALSPLKADDVVDSSVTLPPKPSVEVEVVGDETVTLRFFPIPSDTLKSWVTASNSARLYKVSQWSVKRFMKSRDEFIK